MSLETDRLPMHDALSGGPPYHDASFHLLTHPVQTHALRISLDVELESCDGRDGRAL
jgi:hypothetical protein